MHEGDPLILDGLPRPRRTPKSEIFDPLNINPVMLMKSVAVLAQVLNLPLALSACRACTRSVMASLSGVHEVSSGENFERVVPKVFDIPVPQAAPPFGYCPVRWKQFLAVLSEQHAREEEEDARHKLEESDTSDTGDEGVVTDCPHIVSKVNGILEKIGELKAEAAQWFEDLKDPEGEVLGFKCESGLWLRDVALLESKLEGMNTVYVLGALGTADMMGTVDEEYCDLMGSFQDLKECYAFTKAMKVSSLRMESEADGESLGKRARASQ